MTIDPKRLPLTHLQFYGPQHKGVQASDVDTSFTDIDGHRELCPSCSVSRSMAYRCSAGAKCHGCNAPLVNTLSTIISVDPFLTDLRYKLYRRVMKDEDAMSTIKVIVYNWPEDWVVTYKYQVETTARGTTEHEAYDRMTCPLLWSKMVVPESGGKFFDRQWTITTLPVIAEVAKLHCVCSFNESRPDCGEVRRKIDFACSSNDDPLLRKEKGNMFSSLH